ncbi:phosphate ABC transporter ATP-binding protein, PhoT family [Ferrimonas sediminum]|uniref:Phosphate ABC transporter ATP-binding protein, PhoT family n=1 Tax=Ferrimonas sediminum TaxID=718193 RepID=A0A1G9B1A4_9GAMM|nr:phosphate ABC transporter ATP-binding protein [Ferrimonas sediminum]SDK32605.1 phosphate ABC transporter ATP-binding protein, PhoT family [Ferrimonas sediminum]
MIGEIDELSVRFGSTEVLKRVSLTLQERKVHVLSGPSGSGKTTFLRALNRLNDSFGDCHTTGRIRLWLDDQPVQLESLSQARLPYLRQRVGMVFQHPQLLPGTIADNLLLPLTVVAGLSRTRARERMEQGLVQAALWPEVAGRLTAPAVSLSGGQQQRLCLARTLALKPQILLLDEPTASLDPETALQIETLITELSRQLTIVMVSHSPEQAQRLGDHRLQFERGRVVSGH